VVGIHDVLELIHFSKSNLPNTFKKRLSPPTICILELSKKTYTKSKTYKLSLVADFLNIKYERLHRAKYDVFIT